MKSQRIICPKCKYEQTDTDECVKCGVIISKYVEIQKSRGSDKNKRLNGPIYFGAENTSGQGKRSIIPPEIKRWNWGAFFLNFIWALGNKTWIGLLTIVPLAGYVMPVILGFKGNEWAWKNKRWQSIDHFKRVQKKWAIWGACITIPLFISFYGLFFLAFQTGEPTTGKNVESVDWLPPSATDISYYKIDGFGWVRNYDCYIPEDDFLVLAAKRGWQLQENENILFYEKRHPNGGGVTVGYNRQSNRLSVQSNHR
jgi:hypothetical protein